LIEGDLVGGALAPPESLPGSVGPSHTQAATERLSSGFVDRIAAELEGSLEELIELVIEQMRQEIPDYARLDGPTWQLDVESSVRALTLLYIQTVREDRRLSASELAALRSVGLHRAEQGISLDALSTALRVAMRVGWEHAVARITKLEASPDMFRALGQMGVQLLTFVDDVTLAVMDSFLRLHETTMSSLDQTKRSFLQDLLRGDLGTAPQAQTRALAVGFPLRQRYRLLLVSCRPEMGSASRCREAAAHLKGRLIGTFELASIGEQLAHVAVLVPDDSNDRRAIAMAARETLCREGAVAIGTHAPAAATELPNLYSRLRDLLPIALSVYAPGSLVEEDDVGLYAILSAGPAKERGRFIESVLGGLLRLAPGHRAALIDTLVALTQNSDSLRATAAALHIHPKTVQYRTRRIQELTGLSWGQSGDRLRLDVALHLLRLADRPGETADGWAASSPFVAGP